VKNESEVGKTMQLRRRAGKSTRGGGMHFTECRLDSSETVCLHPVLYVSDTVGIINAEEACVFMVALCNRADHYIFAL